MELFPRKIPHMFILHLPSSKRLGEEEAQAEMDDEAKSSPTVDP